MKMFNKTIQPNIGFLALPTLQILQCKDCKRELAADIIRANGSVCPYCGYLYRVPARGRISMVADSFTEMDEQLDTVDPLQFPEYEQKITKARRDSKLREAVITGCGTIRGEKTALAVMDSYFMMGSMGTVVGEKIVRLVEYATERKLPIIIFCASGGARMQEGMHSLIQMSRTTIALSRHSEKGLLYISVLTHPTTGGVTASFAMQGDIILAEPKALIGFAGPRVIRQTVNKTLPEGFQTSEYLYDHGMVDAIVPRPDLPNTLHRLLAFHRKPKPDVQERR